MLSNISYVYYSPLQLILPVSYFPVDEGESSTGIHRITYTNTHKLLSFLQGIIRILLWCDYLVKLHDGITKPKQLSILGKVLRLPLRLIVKEQGIVKNVFSSEEKRTN